RMPLWLSLSFYLSLFLALSATTRTVFLTAQGGASSHGIGSPFYVCLCVCVYVWSCLSELGRRVVSVAGPLAEYCWHYKSLHRCLLWCAVFGQSFPACHSLGAGAPPVSCRLSIEFVTLPLSLSVSLSLLVAYQ